MSSEIHDQEIYAILGRYGHKKPHFNLITELSNHTLTAIEDVLYQLIDEAAYDYPDDCSSVHVHSIESYLDQLRNKYVS